MKGKSTFIDIPKYQPQLDFEEAEHYPAFVFPEYQRGIIAQRLLAGAADLAIVAATYLIFLGTTLGQMPTGVGFEKRLAGIYAAGFLIFLAIYFLLFMLSSSQTPGM